MGKTFFNKLSTEPSCEAFTPKIRDGKLCYQVDIEEQSIKGIKNLEKGLVFAMDYNFQRSFDLTTILEESEISKMKNDATIYIETLGKMHISYYL